MNTGQTQYILIAVADSKIASQLKEGIESSCGTPCLIGVTSSEAFSLASQNSDQLALAILDTALTDLSESLFYVTAEQSIPTLLLSDDYTEACTSCAMSPTIIDAVLKNSDLVSNVIEVVQRLHQNKNTYVLIVNSSASIRHFLSYVVSNYMLNPQIARSGKEALRLLEKQNFPLILIDAYLDDMPGVELTRLIRKQHPPEHTSIIGISGNSDMHISAMFLKSGASDFLNKPFKREELYCRMIQNLKMTELLHHLDQLNVLKNKMLGMAAHDLVTPITSIQGLASILEEGYAGSLTPEQKEIALAISSASSDMLTLVTDILDVSTIESGHMSIEKELIDLNEIVSQQVALAELSAARKSLSLHQKLEPLDTIQGDPKRIAQLIDNLLSNAIKFSEPETTIHINTKQDDLAIQLIVKDEGPGIAKNELEQLFTPFSKGTATPTGDESSHGLGLHIVKRIASAHNCVVDVASTLGKGTQFTVSFPLQAASK
ncbi:hybrid sensor histidine kinase/response regulator [Halodesulfovibrio marinisediminis]|uniref:histidine kinase n=1 Tax=Halodesulfovibrio marinisediminis DSM 17456 TaxID=1121457 RepID=A0A1N6H8P0_9BACT|nr:hybrid sensor histidine kinase/response regulator [Halodesulfovibrio marinisediminis]SIO16132.1 His Kinase A (phospho-acceptor) domain-containing protein [Halodesulfovibrio marinisediminis DSM 17456]